MNQLTFDFLKMPEFTRRFPNARTPQGPLPTASRDGIVHLLETEHDGKYYLFVMRDERPGLIWSRRLRALFQGMPMPIAAVAVSTNAVAHQAVRESLQWHFIDVTAPEDDFPPDDRGSGGNGAPIPRHPVTPPSLRAKRGGPMRTASGPRA